MVQGTKRYGTKQIIKKNIFIDKKTAYYNVKVILSMNILILFF
jgi:hypothetical protein